VINSAAVTDLSGNSWNLSASADIVLGSPD
jgi:hypothetical protein